MATLRTSIELRAAPGRPRVRMSGGALAPRLMSAVGDRARVALVATQALLLGGDEVEIEIAVGAGVRLDVVEVGGTVAYAADGERSGWRTRITVGGGGVLEWAGQPMVISDGADVLRHSTIELEDQARVLLRETVVLGRTGERGGALTLRTRAACGDRPLYAEDLDLAVLDEREAPGILGSHRILDQVTLLGVRAPRPPELAADKRFDLAGPGTLGRYLGTDLAASPAARWWDVWRPAVESPVRA